MIAPHVSVRRRDPIARRVARLDELVDMAVEARGVELAVRVLAEAAELVDVRAEVLLAEHVTAAAPHADPHGAPAGEQTLFPPAEWQEFRDADKTAAAYIVVFVIVLAYVAIMAVRAQRFERDLDQLQRDVEAAREHADRDSERSGTLL